MAAAITLTIGAAIILGNGHYPNNGFSPLDPLCLAPLGPPHLLGPQGNPTVVSLVGYLWQPITLTMERDQYLWQRPLP